MHPAQLVTTKLVTAKLIPSFEQGLTYELCSSVELKVDVGLLHEAVPLVLRHEEPHRRAAPFEVGDDLLGLGMGHARVVQSLHDEERLGDSRHVIERRDGLEEGAHRRIAL